MKTSIQLFLVVFICACCTPEMKVQNDIELPGKLLLKDFRPESIYNVPRTQIEKAKYGVIDIHSHSYAKTTDEVTDWISLMDEVGVEKTIILSMATGSEFDEVFQLYSQFPDRFEVWCGIDYTGYDKPGFGPAAVAELERCVKMGAKGVGELADKGKGLIYSSPVKAFGMHPDDPRMDAVFNKCAELNLPVNIHIADPVWMYERMDSTNDGLMNAYLWRMDNKDSIAGHAGMIKIFENTLKRHPETRFIACHFINLSYDLSILAEMLDQYPNLIVDNSARYFETGPIPRRVKKFYENYADRILYGTDMGRQRNMYHATFRILESADEHFYPHEYEFDKFHWPVNGFDLSDETLKKIYKLNAVKLYE